MNRFSRGWIFPAGIIAALIWLGAQTLTGNSGGSSNSLRGVAFESKGKGSSPWWSILTSLLPFVLLFGFWVFLMRMVKQRTPTGQDPPETRPRY